MSLTLNAGASFNCSHKDVATIIALDAFSLSIQENQRPSFDSLVFPNASDSSLAASSTLIA